MSSLISSYSSRPYSPFHILSQGAFDKIFNDFYKEFENTNTLAKELFSSNTSSVPYDVISIQDKNGNEIGTEIQYALSGYSKDDLFITVEENVLQIVANKDISKQRIDDINESLCRKVVYNGIKHSNWKSSWQLGSQVDVDNISTKFENSILIVNIPYKNKTSKFKVVEVN